VFVVRDFLHITETRHVCSYWLVGGHVMCGGALVRVLMFAFALFVCLVRGAKVKGANRGRSVGWCRVKRSESSYPLVYFFVIS